MVEQAKKRLFFASPVRVEGPGQERLPIIDQGQIGPHADDALRAAVSAATAGDEIPGRGFEQNIRRAFAHFARRESEHLADAPLLRPAQRRTLRRNPALFSDFG